MTSCRITRDDAAAEIQARAGRRGCGVPPGRRQPAARPTEFMPAMRLDADAWRHAIARAAAAAAGGLLPPRSRPTSDTPYGRQQARRRRGAAAARRVRAGRPSSIFRLPNVFGKWARPNYNSAVATFCHNIARGLPIRDRRSGRAAARWSMSTTSSTQWLARCWTPRPAAIALREAGPVTRRPSGELADAHRGLRRRPADAGHVERVGDGPARGRSTPPIVSYLPAEASAIPCRRTPIRAAASSKC